MRKPIAVLLIGLVFLMPMALAETNATAQARSVSALDLRFKQVGEAFGDFSFKVKAAFTFDNSAKLDLLKERNAELKARQESWVETKQEAMASFKGNVTAKQKQSIVSIFQAEHEAIIEDRLELTSEIRKIQLEAKAEGDTELETEAEAEADAVEDGSFLGISLGIGINSETRGDSKEGSESRLESRVESEAEAKAVVRKKLGFEATESKTEVQGNTTFFVVSGTETEVESDFTMTREFEVWVDSETGMITSVDMDTHIESRGEAETEDRAGAEIETESSSSASASSSTSASGSTKSKSRLGISID